MTISSVEELLEREEEKVPYAYPDSEGYLTIAIGRLIDRRKGGGLSDDEIRYLLANDIKKRRTYLSSSFKWFANLDPVRQAVVISMVFQTGGLETWPKFCNCMAVRDYLGAADAMLDSKVAREQSPARWQRQAQMMRTGLWV